MSGEPARQSRTVNLLLAFGVALLLVAGIEGVARVTAPGFVARPVADYIWDWQRMWDGDFYTISSPAVGWPPWEEFNPDGVRDRAHPEVATPRTWRLVFLGDSVTLGAGLRPGDDYPRVLAEELRKSGRRIEVFNVALWGWSTVQQRRAYARIVRKYRPDQVVLAVCLNDIPELQNNLSRPPAWLATLYRHSAAVRRIVGAQRREIANVEQLFDEPESPRVQAAFDLFLAQVRLLRDEVEADGARFAMVVFPFRFQVEARPRQPRVQERIADLCRAESMRCLDLLPLLAQAGEAAFLDYDHLSVRGARLVASHLASSRLLPEGYSYPQDLAAWRAEHPQRAISDALVAPDAAVREAAAWRMGRRGVRGDVDGLVDLIESDPDGGVRATAAHSLGTLAAASQTTVDALFAGLDDESQSVRWQCADALAEIGLGPEHVEALVARLSHDDPRIRGFAAWSLGEMGAAASSAAPALMAALEREGAARAVVAQAIADVGNGGSELVAVLIEALHRGDAQGRAGAAQTLGRMGPRAANAVPALIDVLGDREPAVRLEAARALSRLGPSSIRATPELKQRLTQDEDPRVRALAARALGAARSKDACGALAWSRQDAHRRVRREAAAAYRTVCEPPPQ